MANVCKGICHRLAATTVVNELRYKSGQKWCSLCAVFIKTDNIRCPCCKAKLRSNARSRKRRKK